MVVINEVSARAILDSREEKTIEVSIGTNVGKFTASSPTGKSTGKHEKKSYKKNLDEDIKAINKFKEYFSEDALDSFEDLRRIEDIVEGHVGANTIIALECAVLKAIAKEQNKEVWQVINPRAKGFPRLVGNCIGGGKHSNTDGKRPDFQEFLLIPDAVLVKENYEFLKKAKKLAEEFLKKTDKNFKGKRNEEYAWLTSLNDKDALEILKLLRLPIGIDVAASSFYKRKNYQYKDPLIKRTFEEQAGYLTNLIKNFELLYIEDPFYEEDFEGFASLLKKFPNALVVGDDLITTNVKRLEKAIKMKSINAVIVKPNQCGSLLEVKNVCETAKKNKIKIVFSHRSGETEENILADLAFGFEADFLKCGITGKERISKIERLIKIENSLKFSH